MLLFLKNVEKISVGVWIGKENQGGISPRRAQTPNMYYCASIESLTPELKSLRAFVTTAEAAAKLAASTKDAEGVAQQQTIDYTLTIRSTWKNDAQNANVVFNGKLIVSDKPNNNYNNTEHGEYAVNLIEKWIVCNQLGVGNLHISQPIKTIYI